MKYKINQYVRDAFLKAKAKISSSVASRALLTALATFTVLAPLGSAQAVEVDANTYQAFYGDVNSDGLNDIYLAPKPKYIPIATDVMVIIPLPGEGDGYKLLAQASGYAAPELDNSIDTTSLSASDFQLLSGDFNGDGVEDTFVQSTSQSLLSLTLANNLVEDRPYVLQTFASLASDTHNLTISDLNDDGRDDISYTVGNQSQSQTLYASNLGHLQSAGQAQVSANYGYDYLNKRRYKVVEKIGEPRQEVIYIDDQTELRDGKLQKYITLGGQKIARSSQVNDEFTPTEFYLNNHLGSIALTLDATAQVKNAFTYEPYGDKQVAYGETDLAPYGFTGKEQDPETQLGYFHHRYLNSKVGQFITPDPVFATGSRFSDPQLWSPYAYARNNPIIYRDPDGRYALLYPMVHEEITANAADNLGLSRSQKRQLISGVRDNDFPGGLLVAGINALRTYKFDSKDNSFARSHYGDRQFWHSMASGDEVSNAEVVSKIISQAEAWWKSGSYHDLGKLLHTVQDSYSGSHVLRNSSGEITSMLNYSEQDPDIHATHDKGAKIGVLPGTASALKATKDLIEIYKNSPNGSFDSARNYLNNNVYRFSGSAASNAPGGVELKPRAD